MVSDVAIETGRSEAKQAEHGGLRSPRSSVLRDRGRYMPVFRAARKDKRTARQPGERARSGEPCGVRTAQIDESATWGFFEIIIKVVLIAILTDHSFALCMRE